MRERLPTLTDLIRQLEEHRQDGVVAIEYRVDELLEVLRWNNAPEGHAEHQVTKSLEKVMEYIGVLGPEESETALRLVFKAVGIHRNAELVETWLASFKKNGGQR